MTFECGPYEENGSGNVNSAMLKYRLVGNKARKPSLENNNG